MSDVHFDQMTFTRPDLGALEAEYAALHAAFEAATNEMGRVTVLNNWDAIKRRLATSSSLVHLKFAQDTRDADRKADREFFDELSPKLMNLDVRMMKMLLNSEHRPELEDVVGEHAFELWACECSTFEEIIEDDLVTEAKLGAEYTEMLAGAEIEFRGEKMNLPGITKYFEDADRETRHDAYATYWAWFGSKSEDLDGIYDKLVKLRDGMAKKLGYKDFVELGYKRMSRIDYNREDVERYRNEVREKIVPICAKIRKRQRETLGVDALMMWDEPVHDVSGNPKPDGDHDWMIDRATEMFDEMGSGLDEFWRTLHGRGLIDLKMREGKAGGGFCTSFPDYQVPFIYANFTGTKGDVEVFTHEMGHAFQNWMSRNLEPMDYLWPSSETCEIHSMSLEFLTWPHMEKFFGDDADRFRRVHLTGSLLFLPYGVAVDHFQHLIYENPNATPAERNAMWKEVEAMYMPWREYGDIEYPSTGAFWQRQLHIYGAPFYYIDYTLAQICALQFWIRDENDHAEAMDAYVKLCARGGEAAFQTLVKGAGLKSPFEAGSLSEVADHSAKTLGL
jgi:M3 family oligoendopeptidase